MWIWWVCVWKWCSGDAVQCSNTDCVYSSMYLGNNNGNYQYKILKCKKPGGWKVIRMFLTWKIILLSKYMDADELCLNYTLYSVKTCWFLKYFLLLCHLSLFPNHESVLRGAFTSVLKQQFYGDVSLRTMLSLGWKGILLCCWAGWSITPLSGLSLTQCELNSALRRVRASTNWLQRILWKFQRHKRLSHTSLKSSRDYPRDNYGIPAVHSLRMAGWGWDLQSPFTPLLSATKSGAWWIPQEYFKWEWNWRWGHSSPHSYSVVVGKEKGKDGSRHPWKSCCGSVTVTLLERCLKWVMELIKEI